MESTRTGLCPGYEHVEQFGTEEEYESGKEEVSYVTFDLGNVEPALVPGSSSYRLIDLDTPTPYLQLSGTILKGRHDSLLGTELVFADNQDPQGRNKHSVAHVANTEQRVTFKEVRLEPRDSGESGSYPAPQVQEDKDGAVGSMAPVQSKRGKGRRKGTKQDKEKGKAKVAGGDGENDDLAMDTSAG